MIASSRMPRWNFRLDMQLPSALFSVYSNVLCMLPVMVTQRENKYDFDPTTSTREDHSYPENST